MPRLTEQEQQEVVRFIEADRPLPEKYRFLLFEDKREAEQQKQAEVAVKVVDIFGNDTMTIVEVNI